MSLPLAKSAAMDRTRSNFGEMSSVNLLVFYQDNWNFLSISSKIIPIEIFILIFYFIRIDSYIFISSRVWKCIHMSLWQFL